MTEPVLQSPLPAEAPAASGKAASLSRRAFARMLGLPVLAGSSSTLLVGCLGSGSDEPAAPPVPAAPTLSRGAFVASISDYFDWVHSSLYNDQYKRPQATFSDVQLGVTPYSQQIETALEEAIIPHDAAFRPDAPITREDAADVFSRAFGLQALEGTNPLAGIADAADIADARRAGVAALLGLGLFTADAERRIRPKANLLPDEAQQILQRVQSTVTAPPQVMSKSGTTAPRRFLTLSSPTPGAAIYYTETRDGSEPADPAASGRLYDFYTQGVLQYAFNGQLRLKAVAMRDGMANSAVREFRWNLGVPATAEYEAVVYHEAAANAPKIWKIFNKAENLGPFVYYMEGSTRGLVFDCGQIASTRANLKTFVDSIATKPYDMIVGHNHPDHSSQITNFTDAGIPFYASGIEKAAFMADSNAARRAAGGLCIAVADGHEFALGNCNVSIFIIPGHTNGTVTALVNEQGWVFGSDMWGCNRPATADTTQYNSVKVDLFLSLTQQLLADYRRRAAGGLITEVTNAHQEVPVGMECVNNFLLCFQKLIDEGDRASEPSIRGGTANRMSKVGDMWRDKNWMAIGPIGAGYGRPVDYLSSPTTAFPNGITIDYNTDNGYRKYSVLSNIEFEGAMLVGVNVYWAAPANGTPNMLPNKFDPWTFDYTITVPASRRSIVVKPTALSNRITSMRVNGQALQQGESITLAVSAGSRVVVEVVSPDGSSFNRYNFTVALPPT